MKYKMRWSMQRPRYAKTEPDPTHASAELGAKLWAEVVDDVAETLRSIAEDSRPMSPVDDNRLHFLQHSNG